MTSTGTPHRVHLKIRYDGTEQYVLSGPGFNDYNKNFIDLTNALISRFARDGTETDYSKVTCTLEIDKEAERKMGDAGKGVLEGIVELQNMVAIVRTAVDSEE